MNETLTIPAVPDHAYTRRLDRDRYAASLNEWLAFISNSDGTPDATPEELEPHFGAGTNVPRAASLILEARVVKPVRRSLRALIWQAITEWRFHRALRSAGRA